MSDVNSPQQSPWAQLIQRAIEDPDFRESLVADPQTVITETTGADLPENLEIVVVEDMPNRIHIVLPSIEIELDQIQTSGGWVEGPRSTPNAGACFQCTGGGLCW